MALNITQRKRVVEIRRFGEIQSTSGGIRALIRVEEGVKVVILFSL
jgi:hypothetical protein